MSFSGNNTSRAGGVRALVLIAVPLVVLLLALVGLGQLGVIDGPGPFGKHVPKVQQLAKWPATAGELKLVGSDKPQYALAGLDYDWEVSTSYSTGSGDDYQEHHVSVAGSTNQVKDVIGDIDVKKLEPGYCGTRVVGRLLTRECGVARGSIVAMVESPPVGPSDEELIKYATDLAQAVA
ncbi:hypothetical protein AB0E69_10160 [Kribbella sp. NPDC026611]|uniref:hypothetical protein n=1 Tax=Kribbella sp. NPDC026611 TaxID=3154911 RepID=UPI0033FAD06E